LVGWFVRSFFGLVWLVGGLDGLGWLGLVLFGWLFSADLKDWWLVTKQHNKIASANQDKSKCGTKRKGKHYN
jgi:hypothetical protein